MKIKSNLKTIKQKKEIKKIPFTEKINKKQKSKQTESENNQIFTKKKNLADNRYKIFTKEFDLSVNAKSLASKSELNSLRKI